MGTGLRVMRASSPSRCCAQFIVTHAGHEGLLRGQLANARLHVCSCVESACALDVHAWRKQQHTIAVNIETAFLIFCAIFTAACLVRAKHGRDLIIHQVIRIVGQMVGGFYAFPIMARLLPSYATASMGGPTLAADATTGQGMAWEFGSTLLLILIVYAAATQVGGRECPDSADAMCPTFCLVTQTQRGLSG